MIAGYRLTGAQPGGAQYEGIFPEKAQPHLSVTVDVRRIKFGMAGDLNTRKTSCKLSKMSALFTQHFTDDYFIGQIFNEELTGWLGSI